MKLESEGIIGGDWFSIGKSKRGKLISLKDIDLYDYHIIKATSRFRIVNSFDLLTMRYSKYILFKKIIYPIDHIEKWIENTSGIKYLNRPFPNFDPDKIKIIRL